MPRSSICRAAGLLVGSSRLLYTMILEDPGGSAPLSAGLKVQWSDYGTYTIEIHICILDAGGGFEPPIFNL